MATKHKNEKDGFTFEIEDEEDAVQKPTGKAKDKDDIVIEDDTPEADRGKTPMPADIVKALEEDDLEQYDAAAKAKLKQLKKVWHDERREKERALREHNEALAVAKKALEENKRLKTTLSQGEKTYLDTYKSAAEIELASARKEYKEAYESGDADKVLAAQEKLTSAQNKVAAAQNYKPSLQTEENDVKGTQEVQKPQKVHPDTQAWYERNPWWGTDYKMTSLASGVHAELIAERGQSIAGTAEYWQAIDTTMRKHFPEYFGEKKSSDTTKTREEDTESKPATVVAPATRSTSSKKIVLRQSQLAIAKKLGLTPEQYAREYAKLEK